jgi:uncharacterized Ntn-hydrolase superfamily protein
MPPQNLLVLLLTWMLCLSAPGPLLGESVPPEISAALAKNVATFSIVAFDPTTGDLGVAVASKFFGVGSVVPWAKAGVGAVATQAFPNVRFGPDGLNLLAAGTSPADAVQVLTEADPDVSGRQFAIIDAHGNTAAHTGAKCFEWAGHLSGKNHCVQGNILTGEDVLTAMSEAFKQTRARPGTELADALIASLNAGQAAGGDKRGRQSAALLVVRQEGGIGGGNDRYIDLRVEDHAKPIEELTRLLGLHKAFFKKTRP